MLIAKAGYAVCVRNDPVKRSASWAVENVHPNVNQVSQVSA